MDEKYQPFISDYKVGITGFYLSLKLP